VHRGIQVGGDLITADFGLSALNPSITAGAVADLFPTPSGRPRM
jgi:hypothetical protein